VSPRTAVQVGSAGWGPEGIFLKRVGLRLNQAPPAIFEVFRPRLSAYLESMQWVQWTQSGRRFCRSAAKSWAAFVSFSLAHMVSLTAGMTITCLWTKPHGIRMSRPQINWFAPIECPSNRFHIDTHPPINICGLALLFDI